MGSRIEARPRTGLGHVPITIVQCRLHAIRNQAGRTPEKNAQSTSIVLGLSGGLLGWTPSDSGHEIMKLAPFSELLPP